MQMQDIYVAVSLKIERAIIADVHKSDICHKSLTRVHCIHELGWVEGTWRHRREESDFSILWKCDEMKLLERPQSFSTIFFYQQVVELLRKSRNASKIPLWYLEKRQIWKYWHNNLNSGITRRNHLEFLMDRESRSGVCDGDRECRDGLRDNPSLCPRESPQVSMWYHQTSLSPSR